VDETASVTVTVDPSERSPVNTVPGPQATAEDVGPRLFPGQCNAISVIDVDFRARERDADGRSRRVTRRPSPAWWSAANGTARCPHRHRPADINAALTASLLSTPTTTARPAAHRHLGFRFVDVETVDINVTPWRTSQTTR